MASEDVAPDLEALAADAETLIAACAGVDRYLDEIAADDLANDFEWHLELASLRVEQGRITEAMLDKVRVVDAKLAEMSDRHDESRGRTKRCACGRSGRTSGRWQRRP